MARQLLQDGPGIDPPVASGSALVGTTAVDLWAGSDFTPIFARDAKAGKIYVVEAFGSWSTGTASTLTLSPGLGPTSPGTTLGASGAQNVPVSLPATEWDLKARIQIRTIGAKGANSTAMCVGKFVSGGLVATAGSCVVVSFGGTSCLFDSTVENWFTLQKTLTVAGSMTVHSVNIFSRN